MSTTIEALSSLTLPQSLGIQRDHIVPRAFRSPQFDEQYDFFTYEAKYEPGATEEICPARLSEALTEKAQEYAVRAHQALRCRGYSRTDMIVEDDEAYVLETNTIPGMTATSLYPQAAAAAGISFSALLDKLIELALEKD